MSYKVYAPGTIASLLDANEETLVVDVNGNQGTDEASIVTRTGLNATLVKEALLILVDNNLLVRRNVGGTELFWTGDFFALALWNNRATARTWLASNDGGTVADMATSLGVSEGIAAELARNLAREGSAVLIPTSS